MYRKSIIVHMLYLMIFFTSFLIVTYKDSSECLLRPASAVTRRVNVTQAKQVQASHVDVIPNPFFLIGIVGGGGVESNWVHSALRPPIGLLCQPRMITMMEKLVEWLARETEVLGENPAPVPFCPPQTPHAARTRTRAATLGSQRLTAWAKALPVPNP
jgi:hypothetical protein